MVSLRMTYVVSVAKEELFRVGGMVACVKSCWGFLLFLGEPSPGLFEASPVLGVPPFDQSPSPSGRCTFGPVSHSFVMSRFARPLLLIQSDSLFAHLYPFGPDSGPEYRAHHPAPDPPWYYNTT